MYSWCAGDTWWELSAVNRRSNANTACQHQCQHCVPVERELQVVLPFRIQIPRSPASSKAGLNHQQQQTSRLSDDVRSAGSPRKDSVYSITMGGRWRYLEISYSKEPRGPGKLRIRIGVLQERLGGVEETCRALGPGSEWIQKRN